MQTIIRLLYICLKAITSTEPFFSFRSGCDLDRIVMFLSNIQFSRSLRIRGTIEKSEVPCEMNLTPDTLSKDRL